MDAKTDVVALLSGRVEVRPAQFRDYEAVIAISDNIYDGRDVLPTHYHVYLQDARSNCFVLLLDAKIVSFLHGSAELLSKQCGTLENNCPPPVGLSWFSPPPLEPKCRICLGLPRT